MRLAGDRHQGRHWRTQVLWRPDGTKEVNARVSGLKPGALGFAAQFVAMLLLQSTIAPCRYFTVSAGRRNPSLLAMTARRAWCLEFSSLDLSLDG
jgi:hypothetical protein